MAPTMEAPATRQQLFESPIWRMEMALRKTEDDAARNSSVAHSLKMVREPLSNEDALDWRDRLARLDAHDLLDESNLSRLAELGIAFA
ncbi:hypothetical protein KI440_03325 [Candidatus Saccharibacteria bacterium TM7i]|nr:hypothetical protein KI440_03325 [Candidatus Saccharibacteria bacterium TM7i]